eukprot:1159970-Pelagomonas_calceolata.AAC.6
MEMVKWAGEERELPSTSCCTREKEQVIQNETRAPSLPVREKCLLSRVHAHLFCCATNNKRSM